ncbi:TIGR02588 family protein [Coleofasciculus sp. FACHB-64]|uniref:TIGR02588 family protein n=1 Tax=Cyanophyceae TaxID=3028117 RepID=UPI00168537C6|nr:MULTISPECIES: TIGR02588 family protein [unclassified Coleofasciculus]MBD1837005.1 TIGR02588 family protein [Coleofasciculus sp. FACHB-501]MBD1897961.1 TIGR02588 family protein [Coleofasciculus sp. FACHB-129]MBD2048573.1 TIGR02588 family protein [Coleofasciculus sp. FACHB-64]MBD2538992.1 TIGR02588 family protein [Coleofasciculus sp. FACHB-SPT36]
MSQTNQDSDSSQQQRPPRSLAEWVSFAIATSIVALLVGLVLYDWATQKNEPPTLSVTAKERELRQTQEQFYIPFEVTNTGGETAESVQIIAELRVNGKVEETGEQQIDFLSGGEKEEGAFIFSRNPRDGELVVRVSSYKLP